MSPLRADLFLDCTYSPRSRSNAAGPRVPAFRLTILLFQLSPVCVENVECLLSRTQCSLCAHQTRRIGSIGWIFKFRALGLHQLLRFFYSLLDGRVLAGFEVGEFLFRR